MKAATTGIFVIGAAALAACGGDHPRMGAPVAGGLRAIAMLHDATGAAVGRATATEVGGGLRVTIDGSGLPAGIHGAHVHGCRRV